MLLARLLINNVQWNAGTHALITLLCAAMFLAISYFFKPVVSEHTDLNITS